MTAAWILLPALAQAGTLVASARGPSPSAGWRETPVVVAAVGDILLGRGVAVHLRRGRMRSPFERTAAALASADVAVGNLVCAVRAGGRAHPQQEFVLGARREDVLHLRAGGLDVVSLANRNSMDYLEAGLLSTLSAVRACGVEAVGAGRNLQEANRPVVRTVRGRRIAFLAYSLVSPAGAAARNGRAGQSFSDRAAILRAIAAVRKMSDHLVVYFHWGDEFATTPSPDQVQLARACVDAGADAIVGSHPHVLQGVERYRGRLIFYSLGNFVYDQRRPAEAGESVIAKLLFFRDRIEAAVIPVMASETLAPAYAGSRDARRILARLTAHSRRVGALLQAGTVPDS